MVVTLKAAPRTVLGKRNKKLRQAEKLPAVLYGKGKVSSALEISRKEFEKVYEQTGENTLVNLEIAGQGAKTVLIHDVAKHFMKDEPIHVDFYEADLTKKIHAKIPLHFVGVAPAVKELGGVLVRTTSEVEVEALPSDLPHGIEVSIDGLKAFDDRIHLSDLKVSDKVKILGHPEEVIMSVQAPRTEAELEELEKPTAEAEKAVIEQMTAEEAKAKEGEEETKEGGAAKPGAGEGKPSEAKAKAEAPKKEGKKEDKK